jgi:hypothetical protein
VKPVEAFLTDLDAEWTGGGGERISLHVIGSAALMLRHDYERGTKDSDVLETMELTPDIKTRLRSLAGKGTVFASRHGMYLDIVLGALPFLPQQPLYHPAASLAGLKRFSIWALDAVDVVVSKLTRFNGTDAKDIRAMVVAGHVPHGRLVSRFEAAVDAFSMDARADDLKRCLGNLHAVERDFFLLPESGIDLPEWGS